MVSTLRTQWSEDGVFRLTLDRPDAYNAIDPALRDDLMAAFDEADAKGARAILLTGAGRGFCAGMDLKAGGGTQGVETMRVMRRSSARLAEAVISCPVPLVTAVHGVCAGFALTFALAADLCVAADDARFVAAFVHRALVPDGGAAYLLPRLVGLAQAKRILMLGETVPAPEALSLGMIAAVVPAADLTAAAEGYASRLAALPVETLAYTKGLLSRSFDLDLGSALYEERAGQGLVMTTPDYAEARDAFREKRQARFGSS
jgi:2-(1,2-epoxy-1,2-dihydrophenyl)acetyl-CoA isomerase